MPLPLDRPALDPMAIGHATALATTSAGTLHLRCVPVGALCRLGPSYVAAREAAPAFARRLGTEAARRGALDVVKWRPWDGPPAELRLVMVLGDGDKWIWEHVATVFGDERAEIVDWYHASEHLWTVATELLGEDTPETKAWATTALDRLWTSGPKPVLECFDATQPKTVAAATVLQRERG